MTTLIEKYSPMVGRILLSLIFVSSGLNKIFAWKGTTGYMAAHGMPMVDLFLFGAIVLEVAGGLSVILGYKAKWGALLLIIFLIPATIIFHAFWASPEAQKQMQMIMFMKNISIMGGLLYIFGVGSGPLSLDNRK
jgi:putative oxidoreductase